MKSLNAKSKRTILAIGITLAILIFILWYSAPIEYGTLPVNITINTLEGQTSSSSLPLQIVLESEMDIANAKVEVTLPDDVLLLEGDLSWKIDLIAHESQVWTVYVEPNISGLATITVTVLGKVSSEKTQTASTNLYISSERVQKNGSGAPQVPLDIIVTIFPAPMLGEVVQLHSLVTALTDSPTTSLEIILSESLSLVEGDLLVSGGLAANETLWTTASIRVDQEGELLITITADMSGQGVFARNAHLYFQVGTSDEYAITQFPLRVIRASGTLESNAERDD